MQVIGFIGGWVGGPRWDGMYSRTNQTHLIKAQDRNGRGELRLAVHVEAELLRRAQILT